MHLQVPDANRMGFECGNDVAKKRMQTGYPVRAVNGRAGARHWVEYCPWFASAVLTIQTSGALSGQIRILTLSGS